MSKWTGLRRLSYSSRGRVGGAGGGAADPAFVSTWETTNTSTGSSASNQIALPLVSGGTYDFEVDWGDGSSDTITAFDQAEVTHTYAVAGEYELSITGDIEGWQFNSGGDRLKILDIQEWGPLGIDRDEVYEDCTNLSITATDIPTITITSFQGLFRNSGLSTVPNMGQWDVSAVTSFSLTFREANSFEEDISDWDVSSGSNFSNMLRGTAFNHDISNWNMGSATDLSRMFFDNTVFDQPIGAWNTANVTTMFDMFRSTSAFDQDISNWNIENVTDFTGFLEGAKLSTANYDALLVGWEAQAVNNSLSFHGGSSTYSSGSAAATARQALIDDHLWTITDGGAV